MNLLGILPSYGYAAMAPLDLWGTDRTAFGSLGSAFKRLTLCSVICVRTSERGLKREFLLVVRGRKRRGPRYFRGG